MNQEKFDSLMSAATTYGTQMTATFNLFITVAFGSLAFAAAMPLANVGTKFIGGYISSASLLMAVILMAFYIISFLSFIKLESHLRAILEELYADVREWGVSEAAANAFKPDSKKVFGLSLPAFGFLIGSIGCLVVFVWVTNAPRVNA